MTLPPIADQFAPAARAEWQALVEKTLKGAGVESLDTITGDGLTIRPLYERDDSARRFIPAPRRPERPWDIRTRVRSSSPAAARHAALEDLAGGATSVILALRQNEAAGIEVRSAADLGDVLDGILFDVAPVALDAGFLGPAAADWLSQSVKGSPSAPLALHLDPLSAFACAGASDGPIESHILAASSVAHRLAAVHPMASQFLASGAVVHEAGGGAALEMAYALASGHAYLKAQVGVGLAREEAASRMVLGLTIDADPLISIAKMRAARMVWARWAGACGVAATANIEARSSMRMLTRAEPWTNMMRLTGAALAGAVGGADTIVLATFTDALGAPTPFARRMARNTQLILMEESRLGAVADPVAGSGAFDALSLEIARAAWKEFNAIEAAGGAVAALCDGLISARVAADLEGLRGAIASGAVKIVGVTDFRSEEIRRAQFEPPTEASGEPPGVGLSGPDSHCPPLKPVNLEDLDA